MSRYHSPRPLIAAAWLLALAALPGGGPASAAATVQPTVARQATPAKDACDSARTRAATPATPMAGVGATPAAVGFDQTYIDMMLPHHASVIALSESALPRLENPDLRAIAMNIISSQQAELTQLSGYREQFYGSATPEPIDAVMDTMATSMPEAHALMMADMAMMDSDALVAEFCGQSDADLAFIDLVIPHHQSAVAASQVAVTRATHPEIRQFAQGVIDAQQAEIDQMTAIRATLAAATPSA